MLLSEPYTIDFPSTEPQIFVQPIDGKAVAANALSEVAKKFSRSLVQRMFPVTVLSVDGPNVVLSGGAGNLVEGSTYRVVKMGAEMTDPQTKQSLGRVEKPFGTVVISKIQPNMSYGELNGAPPLGADEFKPGMLELRDEVNSEAKPDSSKVSAHETSAATAKPPVKKSSKEDDDFLK